MKKFFIILFTLASLVGFSQSTTIVISQVYGGGGGATGTYNADFVELHNISSSSQDISGYLIMYGSSGGNLASTASNSFAFPAGTVVSAGGYVLVATVAGAGLAPLPVTSDFTFTLNMSGTNGKVAFGTSAMVANTTYLLQPAGSVIDFVGYGSANEWETAAVGVLTSTNAALRNNSGCDDTNNNLADFTVGAPAPRNSSTAVVNCGSVTPTPSIIPTVVSNFGNILILTNSSSQSCSISGVNLTGAPGNLTITSPAVDFQVSSDNTNWGATCSIPYTSATLSSTNFYIRFTPQTIGYKLGNVTIAGGGLTTPVNVVVKGYGTSATPLTPSLVISQVYGAGGNLGATYKSDYIELHNSTFSAQSISGYSIQYYSSTGTAANWTGKSNLPSAIIPAGGYYLIRMGSDTSAIGLALPTPDFVATPFVTMGQSAGRVALVSDTNLLSLCPTTPNIIDLVGYGPLTICFEGSAPTSGIDSTKAAFRNNNGCDDTNNNLADFTILTPAPRNSATPIYLCTVNPVLSVNGTLTNFGSIVIGSNSTSQTFILSGSNLTGAPGNITVAAPSSYQVSLDGTNWVASVQVPYSSSTLANTTIYVRFTPLSAGALTGNITISGGGVASSVTVAVGGTGVDPSQPSLSTSTLTAFGSVCTSTTAGPNSFTITGSNLTTADITIAALTGYTYSTTSGGSYTSTLTLTHAAGSYSQAIYVKYSPSTVAVNNGNIVMSGGGVASSVNIAASGSGVNTKATVVTGAASLITTTSAVLAGSISANGCSAVTAYGVEYSTTNGFASGTVAASTNIATGSFSSSLSGLLPGTTYYYKAFATNGGGTAYGVQLSFTTTASAQPQLSATPLTDFSTVCIGVTEGPNIFTLTGTTLTNQNITVGPLTGYLFCETANGTYTSSISITQPGGSFTGSVYVKFAPTQSSSYNGNIPVSGGGVTLYNVPVTGAGDNIPPAVTTGGSVVSTPNDASLSGVINNSGCNAVTERGIEYSGINGFADGNGIKVIATDIVGQDFTSVITGLVPNTTYYYKAYAKNTTGTGYGTQESFMTGALPSGIVLYGNPVTRGGVLHYSYYPLVPGHYSVKIYNCVGQLVLQHDIIAQVNFIDDRFTLPWTLGPGLYSLQIENNEFHHRRQFMIR